MLIFIACFFIGGASGALMAFAVIDNYRPGKIYKMFLAGLSLTGLMLLLIRIGGKL